MNGNAVHPLLRRPVRVLYERLSGNDFMNDPAKPQLVSIAGTIGVGKTILASGLAERFNARLLTEQYDENPFLADVYAGHSELALDSELFFLSSSASQLRKSRLEAGENYVSDYVFDKSLIYASYWLGNADLECYEKQYAVVFDDVAPPALVIYLNDNLENCLERIHHRNRPYEQQIETSFLEHLVEGFETHYTDYAVCPVMRLRPDECRDAEQVDRIGQEVKFYLGMST